MALKLVTLLKEIGSIFIDTAPFIYYIEEYEIKVIVLEDIVK